jgi:hypothetical protein
VSVERKGPRSRRKSAVFLLKRAPVPVQALDAPDASDVRRKGRLCELGLIRCM